MIVPELILSAVVAGFAILWQWVQSRKLQQDKTLHRESHNLDLFKVMAERNQMLQLSAAAVLVERLRKPAYNSEAKAERRSIIRGLISVLKDAELSPDQTDGHNYTSNELIKFVAEHVLKEIGALSPPSRGSSPMSEFDWQTARLDGAYLRDLNAAGIDLWRASFISCGLRKANFTNSILKEADLRGSVLTGAKLDGCDLRNADLRGVDLSDVSLKNAVLDDALFDEHTTMPTPAFTAEQYGMQYYGSDHA